MKNGKQITEATLYLEMEEHQWKITLRALMFHFASFKSPLIKLEKDNITDQANEREAAFYERMYVLEEGLQLFDSLYAAFLRYVSANHGQRKRRTSGSGWSLSEVRVSSFFVVLTVIGDPVLRWAGSEDFIPCF